MPHPQPHKLPSDPSQLRQRREEAYSGRGNFMPVQSSVGSRCRRPVTFRPRRGTSGPISFTCNTYAFLASKDLFQVSSIDHSPRSIDERESSQDVGTSSTVGQANDTATEDAVVSTILHPVAFNCIFPFVQEMLLDIGAVQDPEKVGYYAGVVSLMACIYVNSMLTWQVESIFSLVQLFTIFHWGALSDRIGRKPVLIIVSLLETDAEVD
jgi:hypothetical protein